jgi:hypothetical protein
MLMALLVWKRHATFFLAVVVGYMRQVSAKSVENSWMLRSRRLVISSGRFGGTYFPHLQGLAIHEM